MISYAQNSEDVVLARVFAGERNGRYVDLGAGDPVESSVTKHFYDLGWRGINVEPIPAMAERLAEARPEDVTLAVAIGAEPGKAVLHVDDHNWGWSTVDEEVARAHEGEWQAHDVEVEVRTLAEVLDEHPGEVGFLKIDVEGAERAVIDGADWTRHRPRVLVIEATAPGSPTPTHDAWEPVLLAAGYRCALFDGLNRFYAKADDEETLRRLATPANVFDEFERYELTQLREHLANLGANRAAETGYLRRLTEALDRTREDNNAAKDYVQRLEERIGDLERELQRSHRYTTALEARIDELTTAARVAAGQR